MMENFQPIRIVANRNKFLFAERFLQKNKKMRDCMKKFHDGLPMNVVCSRRRSAAMTAGRFHTQLVSLAS